MVIRPARADERAVLEDLQRRASLVYANSRAALLTHPESITLPAEHIPHALVAETDTLIVGFAVALPLDALTAELDGLFVDPDAWRQQIGRRLVETIAAGRSLHVIANPNALEFYEKLGFETLGTSQTRFGPAITMRRPNATQRTLP